ncbi:hypothetical protein ES702_03801 [subsurface metagenome]
MEGQDYSSPGDFEMLQRLRNWLHVETSVSKTPDQEGFHQLTVNVQNEAPENSYGNDVVFIGVGLRVSDGRERRNLDKWARGISKSRPSDRQDIRQSYNQGTWVAGHGHSYDTWVAGRGLFPNITPDEQSFGEVLFPSESVVYEMRIAADDLPYIDIKVEGSVSRRHLFHIVYPLEALKSWSQPAINQTLRALNAVDIVNPLIRAAGAIPELGPQTTHSEIGEVRMTVEGLQTQVTEAWKELNEMLHSAPNQEIQDYLRKEGKEDLSSIWQACKYTLESLSSGDTQRMIDATQALRSLLLIADDIKRRRLELMSRFGVSPE